MSLTESRLPGTAAFGESKLSRMAAIDPKLTTIKKPSADEIDGSFRRSPPRAMDNRIPYWVSQLNTVRSDHPPVGREGLDGRDGREGLDGREGREALETRAGRAVRAVPTIRSFGFQRTGFPA